MNGHPGVHYLKYPWHGFWTAMMLVTSPAPRGNVLIDTAFPESVDGTIVPLLRSLGLETNSLGLVINTHSHEDHVSGNARIRQLSGAEFAIHRLGFDALRRAGFLADTKLEDGMELRCGGNALRIIHTPGHSADSICVLDCATGTLFSGDSIGGRGNSNVGLALYHEPEKYGDSLLKIRRLCVSGDVRRIWLGHPELPAATGVVETHALLGFMDASIQTAESYAAETAALLNESPDAGVADLRNRLLEKFGAVKSPDWPELSYCTPSALLAAARNGTSRP